MSQNNMQPSGEVPPTSSVTLRYPQAAPVEGKKVSKRSILSHATYKATYNLHKTITSGRPRKTLSTIWQVFAVTSLIAGWYIVSLALTAANKILLDSLAFPYPLVVTFIHFSGVALVTKTLAGFCLGYKNNITVDSEMYVSTVLPIAFFSSVEIALSNQAYAMVSLSVMTVIKSTLVAATYIASIIAGLETFRMHLMLVLVWIIASVAFSVPGMEIQNGFGVVVLGLAVVSAAIRWVLVHKQLQHTSLGSLDLISLTQPLAALCLLPAALVYDTPDMIENLMVEPTDSQRVCAILMLLCVAIFFACGLLLCEFKLIQLTSSLTLTVAGVGKECLTIGMSTILFKEHLQWRAIVGLMSSIAGIGVYAYIRGQPLAAAADLPDEKTSSSDPAEWSSPPVSRKAVPLWRPLADSALSESPSSPASILHHIV